jgi:hypothetical protein
LGEHRCVREIVNRSLDLGRRHLVVHEPIDRGSNGAWGHQVFVLSVPAEMQNLHGDAATLTTDGTRNEPVSLNIFGRLHDRADVERPARVVRRNATGHDQPDPTPRTFGVKRRHLFESASDFFKAQVHGAHQHAIGQSQRSDGQRFEQSGKGSHLLGHSRKFVCETV